MPDLESLMAGAPPPFSEERDVRISDFMQDLGMETEMDSKIKDAMEALYGSSFPLLDNQPTSEGWAAWAADLWTKHRSGVQHRLHLVERNRLYRKGLHWISSTGNSGWREPPKPRDRARVSYNMIGAALDQRQQIVSEQRPGFKTRPATQDPDDIKKAEAKQAALEYQWDQQSMSDITREATFWAGTDGVSFLELYWDPDVGPWHESFGAEGEPMGPDGQPAARAFKAPAGDVRVRVRRIEEVRVSAEATSTRPPIYWVVKDTLPKAFAIKMYGLQAGEAASDTVEEDEMPYTAPKMKSGYVIPEHNELHSDQDKVIRYTVYCERSEFLPEGLQLVVVGGVVISVTALLYGRSPMVRWTDGSSDPAFYPTPIMDAWVECQMRFNAVLSKWVENVRFNAAARLLAKRQSISSETFSSGAMTVIEAKGIGDLNQLVKPLEGFSLAPDAKELLSLEKKNFEDLTGWNDTSRGQFSSDQSGRAILAIREQLERMFAPPVQAAARAMTDWSKTSIAIMQWGYDVPRQIGVAGRGRPDLVRALTADDLDGAVDVFIDPETLMPLPRALRLQLLDDLFIKRMIPPAEYRRRMPFAFIRDIEYPDEAHTARARRVCEALRQGQWLPILVMDNEAIHRDILEREILLQDDTPQEIRAMAHERWMQLSMQESMKMSGMLPMGSPAPAPQGAPGGPQGASTPAPQQPFAGGNPGTKAGTFSTIGGDTDERRNARTFDRQNKASGGP